MSDENTATDAPKKTRKPRVHTDKLHTLKAQIDRAVKSQERVLKIAAKNSDTAIKARSALLQWGKLTEADSPTLSDMSNKVDALISEGFAPPATRVVKEDFVNGQAVKLRPDFEGVYSMVYSAAERDSMTYDFYDEVSKVAMCKTSERTMAVKLKHIEAK